MVGSLVSLCAQCVAKNLGKSKCFERCTEDEGDPRYWLSPFDLLPPSLLTSVFEALKQTCRTTRHQDHLGLLITKQLEVLDLKFYYNELSEDTAFHLLCLAALHHSPLKKLKFHLHTTSYHKLQGILPAFPHLQVLDVSDTKSSKCVNDSFLALVASTCPHLRSLDVAFSVDVTDVGIQRLCSSSQSSPGRGICSSLVQLDIRCTGVTYQGVRLALDHLVKLEELEWDSVVQVVVDMSLSGEGPLLPLRKVDFGRDPRDWSFEENSLATAIELCPSITHVDTGSVYKPSSEDLRALLQLDNLETLFLGDASRVSFDEDLLVPALEKFGHKSLKFLYISSIEEVNLGAIVEHCSQLLHLCICNVERFTQSHLRPLEPSPGHLPLLFNLDILEGDDEGSDDPRPNRFRRQPSSADLALLLGSVPGLKSLRLSGMDDLSDRIFEEAIARHGFPKLESLSISACPNVTRNVVDLFLERDNLPFYIDIERYRHARYSGSHDGSVIRSDTDPAWKEKLARKNVGPLRISIRYCECGP